MGVKYSGKAAMDATPITQSAPPLETKRSIKDIFTDKWTLVTLGGVAIILIVTLSAVAVNTQKGLIAGDLTESIGWIFFSLGLFQGDWILVAVGIVIVVIAAIAKSPTMKY